MKDDAEIQQERRRPSREIVEIKARLDEGDRRMEALEEMLKANTDATNQIAENTAGITRLTNELEAGTKFLCRCAMAVTWLLEMVNKFYKPILIIGTFLYFVLFGKFPEWLDKLFKLLGL